MEALTLANRLELLPGAQQLGAFVDMPDELALKILNYCEGKDLIQFLSTSGSIFMKYTPFLLDIFVSKERCFPFSSLIKINKTVSEKDNCYIKYNRESKYWEHRIVALYFDETDMGQEFIRKESGSCPALRHLAISAWVVHPQEAEVVLESCPLIEKLDLSDHVAMKDDELIALVTKCLNLTTLNLSGCIHISDQGLITLAEIHPLLTGIDLFNCHQIRDETVIALVKKLSLLATIGLSCVGTVSAETVITLVEKYPQLTRIDLSCCHQINNATVIALAERCLYPKTIDLSDCNVSFSTIDDIREKNSRLTIISRSYDEMVAHFNNVPFESGFTHERLEALMQRPPQLQTLSFCPQISPVWDGNSDEETSTVQNPSSEHFDMNGVD